MNTGEEMQLSENNLLTTIGYGINGKVYYALEGSIFIAGSAIQWLRDGLRMIDNSPESEAYALKSQNKDEVYVVPAFTGLGAPYWNQEARGSVFGLDSWNNQGRLYQGNPSIHCLSSTRYHRHHAGRCKTPIQVLKVDGGAAKNDYLMQFQADILGIRLPARKLGNNGSRSSLPSRSDRRLLEGLGRIKISSWSSPNL